MRYRVPMDESRDRFAESVEVLRKALTQEWFSHDGRFYHIPETTIRPRPRNPERLLEGMRVAWTSPQTLPITARAGLGMLMTNQKSWEEYRQDVRDFNAVRAELGWRPIQPTVVVNVACFDTEDEAWAVMLHHSAEAQDSVLRHYGWKDAERFRQTKGYEQYAKFSEFANSRSIEQLGEHSARAQAFGTPDQVLEKLATCPANHQRRGARPELPLRRNARRNGGTLDAPLLNRGAPPPPRHPRSPPRGHGRRPGLLTASPQHTARPSRAIGLPLPRSRERAGVRAGPSHR